MNNEVPKRIEIHQGDITTLAVDAIVNAANRTLRGGGGVDGAIHRKAGPQLLAECKTIGGCPTGEARITRGYNLPAKFVIHTVGPIYSGKPKDAHLLEQCYRNSLALAVAHQAASVAFPAISCGVYGYPIEDACQIALNTACDVLATESGIAKVLFVLFSDSDFQVYRKHLKALISG